MIINGFGSTVGHQTLIFVAGMIFVQLFNHLPYKNVITK